MADAKLSDLTTIPSIDRTADLLYVVDMPSEVSYKTTVNEMLGFTGGNPTSTTDTQTLTNKTLTSPTITTPTLTVNDNALTIQDNADTSKKVLFELSGITTGNTRTLTVPDASTTLVGTGVTQTLTNKTLTAPTITNPTITVDTISEFTSANGVTIDGLNVKDSKLNTNNSVVTSNVTDAAITPSKWANPYKFSAYCSLGKAIVSTSLIVDLQTELFDSNGNFASSRYTAPVAGFYQINAQAWMGSAGAATTEYGTIALRKNGSATGMPESDRSNGSGTADKLIRPQINYLIQLAANDYIELWATFVGSRDIVAGQPHTWMNGYLVTVT